jgi:hypothetical protein
MNNVNFSDPGTYAKAIAAGLAGALVMFLAKYNIIIADELNNAIEIVLGAVISFVIVLLTKRNKEIR